MKISLHFSDTMNMENYFEYLKNKLYIRIHFYLTIKKGNFA